MKLVIVESPAKARSLEGYLGKDFWVRASYGHVRDLKDGSGSVKPDDDFSLIWDVTPQGKKHIQEIIKLAHKVDEVLLATDPDREGEAIAWHIAELLKAEKVTCPVERIAFNAITAQHVQEALRHPHAIEQNRVEAYLARLSLDYLVGYSLSPVLWKKLPGSKSGGRVQSVALRCIVERTEEREVFQAKEYWHVEASLQYKAQSPFQAKVSQWRGEKLEKFSLLSEQQAEACRDDGLNYLTATVTHLQKKEIRRNPAPPFTTSTLQQDASRRYGFAPSRTMRIAQKLYEGISLSHGEHAGLITYMRTDSFNIIPEVVEEMRCLIVKMWGESYKAPSARQFKKKAKNAQEAHEAIRPTILERTPESVRKCLSDDEFRLYELIWRRTLASQMSVSVSQSTHVELTCSPTYALATTGTVSLFEGFLKLYNDETDGDKTTTLPPLSLGDTLTLTSWEMHQHFTQPPPRYTDASLIKHMEALGIGRPSTYAHILNILKERDYIAYKGKSIIPQERGRMVVGFLRRFFAKYVAYDFTAELEDKLDSVAQGNIAWKHLMKDFWEDFNAAVTVSHSVSMADVLEGLNKDLVNFLFPDGNSCPQCTTGKLGLRMWKTHLFIGCTHYPDCRYNRSVTLASEESLTGHAAGFSEPRLLGEDPTLKVPITLRVGPHGLYLQWGEGKIKRVGLPKNMPLEDISLQTALDLGVFPRLLGVHPVTQEEITVNVGAYGPYIAHQKTFYSLPKGDTIDPAKLTLEEALGIMEAKAQKTRRPTLKRSSSSQRQPSKTPNSKLPTHPTIQRTPKKREQLAGNDKPVRE